MLEPGANAIESIAALLPPLLPPAICPLCFDENENADLLLRKSNPSTRPSCNPAKTSLFSVPTSPGAERVPDAPSPLQLLSYPAQLSPASRHKAATATTPVLHRRNAISLAPPTSQSRIVPSLLADSTLRPRSTTATPVTAAVCAANVRTVVRAGERASWMRNVWSDEDVSSTAEDGKNRTESTVDK